METIADDMQYKKAFKEILTILKYIPKKDYEKIPKDIIKVLETYQDNEFNYQIDFSRDFQNQEISEFSKAILANFYRDYWATDEEKKKILSEEKEERVKIEEQKRIKYNPDNIFKARNESNTIKITKELIEVKKEGFIRKIINKIKTFIKRQNSIK